MDIIHHALHDETHTTCFEKIVPSTKITHTYRDACTAQIVPTCPQCLKRLHDLCVKKYS